MTLNRRIVIAMLCVMAAPAAMGQVQVVTTTPTLADIVRQVGGAHVEVESLMRGPENAHNVVPKPSSMMKLRSADLFVHGGLDGEPWVPELIKGARQARLHPGGEANVDASRGIALKEVPHRGELTRAEGDIHVFGNPHYLLDPMNAAVVAGTICQALQAKAPEHTAEFESNREAFAQRVTELTGRMKAKLEPYAGTEVVVYHRTWVYFLDRFDLIEAGRIEPKPGIPPGPRHLAELVEMMKQRGVRVAIVETFNSQSDAASLARRADGVAIVLAAEVNALPEAATYEKLIEHNVNALVMALDEAGANRSDAGDATADSRP